MNRRNMTTILINKMTLKTIKKTTKKVVQIGGR